MNKMRLVQQTQRVQQLLGKDADEGRTQSTELVLLDEFVEVDAEKLERETQMLPVNESILEAKEMVVIVLVVLAVELQRVSGRSTAPPNMMEGLPDLTQRLPSYSD